ncbi:response regulator [Aeromicrobium sp. UC242_57]|uniref:response regulator n=1 Tax=Aeromicrobium sp. UC242_57 TaxID=3374624 RepID=UPI0037986FA9
MTEQDVVRVVVVDDHPVFRIGMAALLASLDGIDVVGQAEDLDAAVRVVGEQLPDVVLMDLDLGATSGVEATRDILRAHPRVGVLVVTMLGDDDSLFASIRAGARGYLLKGASPDEIERAVRAVANGEVLLGPQVAQRAATYLTGARTKGVRPFPELTDREREVLDLVARGLDNATIARRLVLSSKTVRNYVYGIAAKLDIEGRPQLMIRAQQDGLGADRPVD